MTTVHERNTPRLREVLSFLASRAAPTPRNDVLGYIEQLHPASGEDLDPASNTKSTSMPRWKNQLLWSTTDLVAAGWMTKDGRGTWCITADGRQALDDFPDPQSFRDEAARRYREHLQRKLDEPRRRAWLIRGISVRGANVVGEWLEDGWVSLSASQLREISSGISLSELIAAVEEDYRNLQQHDLKSKVDEIVSFVIRMAKDDAIVTTSDQQVWAGDVAGDWSWQRSEGGRTNLRRTVEWRNLDTPIDFSDLPAPLPAKLASGGTVVDLTSELDLIDKLTTPLDEGSGLLSEDGIRPAHEHLGLPSQALAEELLTDSGWLRNVRDLLDERKQLVLYGPPGTGKTYMARKLAADVVGPEQVRLVQFHPAYTYEDFFEGYRPRSGGDGTIGFELQPGPLRRLVTDAAEQRDMAFVLIIDEINRANLAKVFGELYFLLEYRDQAVELLYSDGKESFTLPPNIYLIGTMNTADRSIALVDSAMRRRFAFVMLDPQEEPTRGLLRRWSTRHGLPSIGADLLDELNERLDDPDFRIGPSYFMRRTDPEALSPDRLERIWNADILPLLQEHFFGQWETKASRFSLGSLLDATAGHETADAAFSTSSP